jgi:Zn-dependent metalloprotease
MRLWSAYVGSVEITSVVDTTPLSDTVVLQSRLGENLSIDVYTLDATHLTEEQVEVCIRTENPLQQLSTMEVSIARTLRNHRSINKQKTVAAPNPPHFRKTDAVAYNGAVDAHFNACRFVTFAQTVLGFHMIDNSSVILVLYGVKHKNGASYHKNGIISVGIGDDTHAPAAAMEHVGYELVRGLLPTPHPAAAGVLREHFTDALGLSLVSFVSKHIEVVTDPGWCLETEMTRDGTTRNIANPWSSKRPKRCNGIYWIVHEDNHHAMYTNSSVGTYLFYLLADRIGIYTATQLLSDVMSQTPQSYEDYADAMQRCSFVYKVQKTCAECLTVCGLVKGCSPQHRRRQSNCTLL